jgi:hypothetical protein
VWCPVFDNGVILRQPFAKRRRRPTLGGGNVPFWKKLFVVLPAFLILHLTATGTVPLLDGLRALWPRTAHGEILLLAGFPVGYAMGAAVGLTAAPGTARSVLAVSLILSIAGLYGFAELADGYKAGTGALALAGFAAGMAMPVAARALGLVNNVVAGALMALLVAAAWWLSLPFVDLLKQGLPIDGTPGWAGPYYAQGVLAALWLIVVLFLGADRNGSRRR